MDSIRKKAFFFTVLPLGILFVLIAGEWIHNGIHFEGHILFYVLCFFLFVASVWRTLYIHKLVSRIELTLTCVRQVEMGHIDSRIESIQVMDEIGALQMSINSMLEQHKTMIQTQQESRENLEKVVEQRTFNLYEMIDQLQQEIINRQRLEKQKEQMQQQLASNSKLVALGEMAGGVAHEINNPLTILASNSKIVQKILDKTDITHDEKCKKIALLNVENEKTVERISKIIKSMRRVSRDASEEVFERVTVASIIDDVLSLCREKLKNNDVDFVLEYKNFDGQGVIECQAVAMSQVFINFIHNAYDAIESLEKKWIFFEVEKAQDAYLFTFIDSGPGIPDEVAERIFTPFFTTKPIGKGTGLGLSLSLAIIKRHSGKVELDKTYSNTKFVITVPAKQELVV